MKSLHAVALMFTALFSLQGVAYAGPDSKEDAQQAIDRIVRESAEAAGADNGPVLELSRDYRAEKARSNPTQVAASPNDR